MRPDLHNEITRRLVQDYGFKKKKSWLSEGKCPACSKREMYTHADNPWVMKCGRLDKCGAEFHVKDLYRELFESWSDRYVVTEEAPYAAADAYLQHARGFPLSRLRGLYTQEYYRDHKLGIGSATVRFQIDNGSWWERLIDRPERFGKQKARFAPGGSYRGHWWRLPDSGDAEELWLTEGVFDTVALELHGLRSAALLSCNNYPEHALADLAKACSAVGRDRPTLVWALDDGPAGRSFMRKWHERAQAEGWDSRAAFTPGRKLKLDWNELHLRGKLDDKALEEARYQGDLLLAESASQKALLIYKRSERKEFHFGYADRLYWFKLDLDRYEKARHALEDADQGLTEDEMREQALRESGGVVELANCYPAPLYYQAHALTDESWYYYRISFPHAGAPIKNTFTAAQLASASEFKKRLLAIAPGAVFTGTTQQLDRIFKDTLHGIKTVQTVDFVGYSKEHGCWVLGDVAVKDGQIHELNTEDYFEVGKLSLKTLNQSVALSINRDRSDYRTEWADTLWSCFGPKGMVALTFWFGSLFAEQIRDQHKSYPFLEIIGEAGSGKSTLVEFLWKLVGRQDYEGFDPSKSTAAARARNFAQVSGLPVVLIEGDRDTDTAKAKAFDWNELKTAYNGRSVRATGVKNGGNETREPPFRGTVVIAQNAEVTSSDAILQRLVHLSFDKTGHTPATKALAEQLERMPVESVSGFVLAAATRERKVMETVFDRAPVYIDRLIAHPEIRSVRVAKNHGQMQALLDALRVVLPLTDEQHAATHAMLEQMAIERQRAINSDHPLVQAFWELFDYLNTRTQETAWGDVQEVSDCLNHSRDEGLIAVNLVEFEERLSKRGLRPPTDMTELKKHLRTSRMRKFVDIKTVNSRVTNSSKKCWVFNRER